MKFTNVHLFPKRGISPARFIFDIRTDVYSPEVPEGLRVVLEMLWAQTRETNPRAQNGNLFAVHEIFPNNADHESALICEVGTLPYAYYDSMRKLLDRKVNVADLPQHEAYWKNTFWADLENFTVLGSMPAMIVEDFIVMEKKSQLVNDAGAGKISFPGAGYLDVDKDRIENNGRLLELPTEAIILREITEETNLHFRDIADITLIGMGKDAFAGSHWSSALFSAVRLSISKQNLITSKDWDIESWEREGNYIFVPATQEHLDALIASNVLLDGTPIPKSLAKDIEGFDARTVETTGKAFLMQLLLGHYLFGNQWFMDTTSKYKKKLII